MRRNASYLLAIIVMFLIASGTWTISTASPRSADSPILAASATSDPIENDVSPLEEQAMLAEIQQNRELLQRTGKLSTPNLAQIVTYGFPLHMDATNTDISPFRVSAFADHNPTIGQIVDYNGGTRTADSHHGTDYALSPFAWNKLDAGSVQVVAAAAGTIMAKSDANPADHHCGSGTSGNWNYIALEHADGRMTIYGHMRYNSVTKKAIGQTVAAGEYLGTVGSSGASSGPHLHFEVRAVSFSAEWIDPYSGPNSQAQSLWANQRPYYDSAINTLSTHAAPPSTPDPCQPSVTNLQDHFQAPANIYFYAYYRDYQGGLVTHFKIYRPDGSVFQSWQDIPANGAFSSSNFRAQMFHVSESDPSGIWRFEASYNGQTSQTTFTIGEPLVLNNKVLLPLVRR